LRAYVGVGLAAVIIGSPVSAGLPTSRWLTFGFGLACSRSFADLVTQKAAA
jgi:hypothetical protein